MAADGDGSLRGFLASGSDLDTIPNLRAIAGAVVGTYGATSHRDLASEARHYEEQAAILERGDVYQERIWNIDHWLVVDEYEPTADNVRFACWLSEALRDRVLADELLDRLRPSLLTSIRIMLRRNVPMTLPVATEVAHVRLLPNQLAIGRQRIYGDFFPVPKLLRIVRYEGADGFYLLYCDTNGNELTVTLHASVDEALAQSQEDFNVHPNEWTRS